MRAAKQLLEGIRMFAVTTNQSPAQINRAMLRWIIRLVLLVVVLGSGHSWTDQRVYYISPAAANRDVGKLADWLGMAGCS